MPRHAIASSMAQSVDDVADQLRLVKQELAAAQQQNVVLKRATVQLEGKVGVTGQNCPPKKRYPPCPRPTPLAFLPVSAPATFSVDTVAAATTATTATAATTTAATTTT